MPKFGLDGFYLHSGVPNGRGRLTGTLEIDEDLLPPFRAEIVDHASRVPRQQIHGHVQYANIRGLGESMQLLFIKSLPASTLANIAYILTKPFDGKVEGEYVGIWTALPYKVTYNQASELFSVGIDLSVCGARGETEITLSRL